MQSNSKQSNAKHSTSKAKASKSKAKGEAKAKQKQKQKQSQSTCRHGFDLSTLRGSKKHADIKLNSSNLLLSDSFWKIDGVFKMKGMWAVLLLCFCFAVALVCTCACVLQQSTAHESAIHCYCFASCNDANWTGGINRNSIYLWGWHSSICGLCLLTGCHFLSRSPFGVSHR